jgi:DNA uptake protein ComE-like DNA-binding protein
MPHTIMAIPARPSYSHGETHHDKRRVDLNSASKEELAELPMVGDKGLRT